jgi:hypothetical protein
VYRPSKEVNKELLTDSKKTYGCGDKSGNGGHELPTIRRGGRNRVGRGLAVDLSNVSLSITYINSISFHQ